MLRMKYYPAPQLEQGSSNGGAILIFALLFCVIVAAGFYGLMAWSADGDLPLTEHARSSHQAQAWNASSIQEYFRTSGCTPREYLCPGDVVVRYCEVKDGLSVGLFIGRKIQQVISGFAARTSYWESRGCK